MTSSQQPDIIIIGAGLAGLAAARTLSRAGKRVLVLEARERAGGRVHTCHDAATSYPIEMGPEWLEGAGEWRTLLDGVSNTTYNADGHHFERDGETLLNRDTMQNDMDKLVAHLDRQLPKGADVPVAQSLASYASDENWDDAKRMLLSYVQGFHAADPARLSTRWLKQVEDSEPADGAQARTVGGLSHGIDALLSQLGENCRVQLNTVVREVHWEPGEVVITAQHDASTTTFAAPRLLITLPLAVLKRDKHDEGAVLFSPSLAAKQPALALLETGHVIKVVLLFRTQFWNDVGMHEAGFIQDFSQPIPTWWTTFPVDAPIITGWMAGPRANAMAGSSSDAIGTLAVASLAHALGVNVDVVRAQLVRCYTHDWNSDPYARGAYSYVTTGGVDAYKILAAPLQNTLFFAGEATVGQGHNATMEGAFQSGVRAAHDILNGGIGT